jgi:hypothetical protein
VVARGFGRHFAAQELKKPPELELVIMVCPLLRRFCQPFAEGVVPGVPGAFAKPLEPSAFCPQLVVKLLALPSDCWCSAERLTRSPDGVV